MANMSKDMIQQFTVLVHFLGEALGPDYEVVLHDIRSSSDSIVAIANGHISGRKIGGPLTNASLKMLADVESGSPGYTTNYLGSMRDGKVVRSSTMIIKNHRNEPVGMLCVNFDDSRHREWQARMLEILHPLDFLNALPQMEPVPKTADSAQPKTPLLLETFCDDIHELMEEVFREVESHATTPVANMVQEERIATICELEKRGLFKLKGSVAFVARKLRCSQASVYRYLSTLSVNNHL